MAMILNAFLSNFSERLMQMVQDEVGMLVGVPDEIEKLKRTVEDIQAVLADAEEKQIKSQQIKRWLMELKDVMYDADDIIDLYQLKYEEPLYSSSSSKSSSGFLPLLKKPCIRSPAFTHEIGTEIKEINAKLQEIAKRKADLGLIETQDVFPDLPVSPSHSRRRDSFIHHKTDSSVVMDDLVGDKIQKDAQLLVSWLIQEEKGLKTNIGVVAIHGMGGIGKTTLAKRIFNDPRIEKEFELRIWACVSKDVNGVELLKSIIQQAERSDVGATEERQVLVSKLQKVIQGKKFLLVLDDIWPESLSVWDELLRAAMNSGDSGNKLLVTTRDERVVNGVHATKSHRVCKLSDEDGWLLLKKQVFQNEKDSEIKEFKNIGLELIRKCDGLPLAIKSIGGVLRMKSRKTRQWEAILRSSVWSINGLPNDIHRALFLSYEDLPSPLKQCFIICSFYPEDYMLKRTNLIYHWIAEGFLQGIENSWEEGNEYYDELLVRNLLEDHGKRFGEYEDKSWSKMHDLWWSFAHYLGKDESCMLTKEKVLNRQGCSIKLRRLSTQEISVNLQNIKNQKGVRTLLIGRICENVLGDLCTTLLNLRILVLKNSSISNLPESFFGLVHLRYFDVSCSKITFIPESIGNLKNLVYLNFSDCIMLECVPNNITHLKKLMHLSFVGTNIVGIPSGLRNFENLIHLFGFKPDNNCLNGLSSLEELEPLLHLVSLQLEDLDKVTDLNLAKRANLYCKKQLQDLSLFFPYRNRKEQVSQKNEKKITTEAMLNELYPPCSLEILKIHNYFGNTLPNWLNIETNLPNLRYLEIYNCNCFESLAPLGQLPNLEYLKINEAYSIVVVGQEFLWGDIKETDATIRSNFEVLAFPKLTELWFVELNNWKEWQWNKGESAMPKLKKLFIEYCPKLKSLPEGLSHNATSLEHLHIFGNYNLTEVVNFSSTQAITVQENHNLERISNLSNVSQMLIGICPKLKTVKNLPNLEKIELLDYDITVLPDYLMTTTPSKLTINCSEELFQEIKCQRENGSNWHKFGHIPEVNIYSKGGDSLIDFTNLKENH